MSTSLTTTDGLVRATDEPGRRQALLPPPQVQNHAANLTVLPDGTLTCVWFAGTQEGVPDISVWFSRLDADTWSPPVQLSEDPTRSEQNPVLHVTESGALWLMWTSQHAGNQDTARVLRRSSCTPSCDSSARIWALREGCAMCNRAAARVKCSSSATVTNARSRRGSRWRVPTGPGAGIR